MFGWIQTGCKRWRARENELFERWASWLPGSNPGAVFMMVSLLFTFILYFLWAHYLDSGIIREYLKFLCHVSLGTTFIVSTSITARWKSRVPVSPQEGIQPFLEKCARRSISLEEIALPGAILINVQLQGAFLKGAALKGANLAFANLEGANLDGACLEQADLKSVNLRGASLAGADLASADLSKAQGLTCEQVILALGNASTRLPDGLERPAHWSSF
jgi:hypothetical protein